MKSMFILSIIVVVFISVSFADEEPCYNETNPAIQEDVAKWNPCVPEFNDTDEVVAKNKAIIKCVLKPEGLVDENDQLDVEKYKIMEGTFITNESKRPAIMAVMDKCANGTNTVDALTYLNCFEAHILEACPNE